MTKLTPHRCDLCMEMVYEGENTIYKLEVEYIESIAVTRSESVGLDWELCQQCYDKFLDWIQSHFKEESKE